VALPDVNPNTTKEPVTSSKMTMRASRSSAPAMESISRSPTPKVFPILFRNVHDVLEFVDFAVDASLKTNTSDAMQSLCSSALYTSNRLIDGCAQRGIGEHWALALAG
jgi:hypothetical protein